MEVETGREGVLDSRFWLRSRLIDAESGTVQLVLVQEEGATAGVPSSEGCHTPLRTRPGIKDRSPSRGRAGERTISPARPPAEGDGGTPAARGDGVGSLMGGGRRASGVTFCRKSCLQVEKFH